MSVIEIRSQSGLNEIVQGGGTVLAEFGARWCPPCKALMPVLEELAADATEHAGIVTVDMDEVPEAGAAFGVMSLPTVIVFVNGVPVDRLVGLRPKETYSALLSRHARTHTV